MRRYLFCIILLISGSIFLFSCRTVKEPEYKGIASFNINGISLDSSLLSVNLQYFNPNNYGLKMKDISGDAYVDSIYLGQFYLDSAIKIPKKADFILPVKLRVSMKNILPNAWSLFGKKEFNMRLEGKCKVGKGGVFFPYPIQYQGKQRLSLF